MPIITIPRANIGNTIKCVVCRSNSAKRRQYYAHSASVARHGMTSACCVTFAYRVVKAVQCYNIDIVYTTATVLICQLQRTQHAMVDNNITVCRNNVSYLHRNATDQCNLV